MTGLMRTPIHKITRKTTKAEWYFIVSLLTRAFMLTLQSSCNFPYAELVFPKPSMPATLHYLKKYWLSYYLWVSTVITHLQFISVQLDYNNFRRYKKWLLVGDSTLSSMLEASLKHKHLLMHAHTHTCTCIHVCAHVQLHMCIMLMNINIWMHHSVHTYATFTYKHVCTYAHTHVYMLTIETHVHTHIY